MSSSELSELLSLCDRIIVMHERKITGGKPGGGYGGEDYVVCSCTAVIKNG